MKLSPTQERALAKFEDGEVRSAYRAQESLATLNALEKKRLLIDVTPPGLGSMFSPSTYYQFKKA